MSPSIHFNPAPDLEAKLLDAITRPDHSLASIATLAATTTEALSLWLARPAVRDRLAALESMAAWRIRLVATFQLEAAVNTLTAHIKNPTLIQAAAPEKPAAPIPYSDSPAPTPPASPSTPNTPADLQRALTSLRAAESLRRAASTLIRLTHFKPIGPTTPVPAPSTTAAPTNPTPTNTRDPAPSPKSEISNPKSSSPSSSASSSEISNLRSSFAFSTSANPNKRPAPRHPTSPIQHPTSATSLLQSAGSARAP